MSGFGAAAYRKVAIDGDVATANPHKLLMMLYDGALESIRLGERLMAERNIPAKCAALAKACRIVEHGLKVALDHSVEPVLTRRLSTLYDYVLMRLLQANLRNDVTALREAAKILADLRSAWAEIGDQVKNLQMPADVPAGAARAPASAYRANLAVAP